MQWLVPLVLSLAAYHQSFAIPTEDDVVNNIACSVYEYRKEMIALALDPSRFAVLKDPNIVSFDKKSSECPPKKKPCSKCMGTLGCFTCEGFKMGGLPIPLADIKTSFRIYTGDVEKGIKFYFEEVGQVVGLIKKPVQLFIIVHGFHSSTRAEWVSQLRNALLDHEDDGVVITVDWSTAAAATDTYMQAIRNSQLVGRQVAVILQRLMQGTKGKIATKRTHWIGHGLGAQMAIFFWDHFRRLTENLIIGKITALDPSKAFFEDFQLNVNVTMARFVEVIHTSTGSVPGLSFGMAIPIGHVDFYMNGGSTPQPGCDEFDSKSASCSHQRAVAYYIEAIKGGGNCSMISYACTGGLAQYKADKCVIDEDYWNVISLNQTEGFPGRGVQFVDTHKAPPFCKIIGKADSD